MNTTTEKSKWTKVKHERGFPLKYEGQTWIVELAEWRDQFGKGELRVYRIEGDITSKDLADALQNEADGRGLSGMTIKVN